MDLSIYLSLCTYIYIYIYIYKGVGEAVSASRLGAVPRAAPGPHQAAQRAIWKEPYGG